MNHGSGIYRNVQEAADLGESLRMVVSHQKGTSGCVDTDPADKAESECSKRMQYSNCCSALGESGSDWRSRAQAADKPSLYNSALHASFPEQKDTVDINENVLEYGSLA